MDTLYNQSRRNNQQNNYNQSRRNQNHPGSEFNQSRIMFAIHEGKLHFAPPKATYSHATWFRKQGWVKGPNDTFIETTVRGFVDCEGIYFYSGFDFRIDDKAEADFLPHLFEMKTKLRLPDAFPLYGGMIKTSQPGKFPTRKQYGNIGDVISAMQKPKTPETETPKAKTKDSEKTGAKKSGAPRKSKRV
jgi:hypothetical protein